jgi:hypothetical protein
MDDNWKMISYMLHKNPLVIVGFIFIGISGVLLAHIQLKMVRIGNKVPYGKYLTRQNFDVPLQYLRIRNQHGWSPWPAYLLWPAAVIGVVCLVIGLFQLQ